MPVAPPAGPSRRFDHAPGYRQREPENKQQQGEPPHDIYLRISLAEADSGL
jgi:hypothetical protein